MSSFLVCGTSSDARKGVVMAGLCRYMRNQGIKIDPFKAQNMSLNSAVAIGGERIGRVQAAQALAAGIEPQATTNPLLFEPSMDSEARLIVVGRPWVMIDGAAYGGLRARPLVVMSCMDGRGQQR